MNNRLLIDRRSGLDRRGYGDRRQGPDRRSGSERRHLSGAGDRRSSGYYDARASNGDVAHGQPPLPVRDNFGRWGVLLADLVAGFYAACLEPAHWPDILVRLKDAVRADVCALGSHDFASGTGRLDQAVNIDPGFIAAYGEGLARHNPWLHQQDRLPPPGSVRSGQMLAEDTELLDGPFSREWLEPQNLFHHIFGILDSSGSAVDYLFFARSREKGAFWDDDLALLSRLLPNLRYGLQAGRNAVGLGRAAVPGKVEPEHAERFRVRLGHLAEDAGIVLLLLPPRLFRCADPVPGETRQHVDRRVVRPRRADQPGHKEALRAQGSSARGRWR